MKLAAQIAIAAALGALAACATSTESAAPAADEAAASDAKMPDSATTMEVHLSYVIPGSNILFAAESDPPETEEQFAATVAGAQQVLDGMGLLMTGSRPPGSEDWFAHIGKVTDGTNATKAALEAGNADELVFTNGDMMDGCSSCHLQFRTP